MQGKRFHARFETAHRGPSAFQPLPAETEVPKEALAPKTAHTEKKNRHLARATGSSKQAAQNQAPAAETGALDSPTPPHDAQPSPDTKRTPRGLSAIARRHLAVPNPITRSRGPKRAREPYPQPSSSITSALGPSAQGGRPRGTQVC